MAEYSDRPTSEVIESVYRAESRRVFATLVRLIGDFDLAEEALHDAFAAAVVQWPRDGLPRNPRAWLVSTGRFKAIDTIRRRARYNSALSDIARQVAIEQEGAAADPLDRPEIEDDRLRLIFTCCHPALNVDAQIALTLREVCGLTTEEIAHAFLTAPATVAQRIVRAKRKIREARIPYEVPSLSELPQRLAAVLHVIYLVFNEGYSPTTGPSVTRQELSNEAIRLTRLLIELLPDAETEGLLALMLLHESRRAARTSESGDVVLLEDQDRSLWDRRLIAEGRGLVERALSSGRFGPYTLQAAIAAVHAEASEPAATDWEQIAALYDVLHRVAPSPVVELNQAVAIAMRDGAAKGLELVDRILSRGELADYKPAHAARADLCRRVGRLEDACESYRRALELTEQEPERRFILSRLAELSCAIEEEARLLVR